MSILSRFLSLTLSLTPIAASGTVRAVGIQGEIRNFSAWEASNGAGKTLVLLTNLAQGKIVGLGTLEGPRFNLTVPQSFKPDLHPLGACPGVISNPSEPNTYTAEQLMLFSAEHNTVVLIMQADRLYEPTRRSQWLYSDRIATVKGRCTGLNTYYDLTLRAGWNAVMTVSESGRFSVKNASLSLPYWVSTKPLTPARTLFPKIFGSR
ncbi:hypothetical protein [Deinococcus hopiensis]|uniref:Uncharacterized protein n=1 Tax=Deinococcus hopiensis KR-140 TaxID=695939 RepID=A0A1W1UTP6_9DEIO|nr:hypothetical protein [Deinococcus hopiensis]SMB84528.1 hypothetical protein SAMN00790413_05175 [Deinococcus hopiensis KR-140]